MNRYMVLVSWRGVSFGNAKAFFQRTSTEPAVHAAIDPVTYDLWLPDEEKNEAESADYAISEHWIVFTHGFISFLSRGNAQPSSAAVSISEKLENHISFDNILADLDGSFSVIAWDKGNKDIYISTDRIGNHNLYYARDEGSIVCSSHPKIISQALGLKELDKQGLSLYLGLKGIPAPFTPILGIKKARPGYVAKVNGVYFDEIEYWNPLDSLSSPFSGSLEEAVKGLEERLESAVCRYGMGSGDQLGVFLSGGLDSTVLAALAKKAGLPIKAFTAGYEPSFRTDETAFAALAAREMGIPHFVQRLNAEHLRNLIQSEISELTEPVADATLWPELFLARKAAEQVSAMLDGTGADSLLGGSNKYAVKRYADLYLKVPGFLRKNLILPVASLFPGSRRWRMTNFIRMGQMFLRSCELPAGEQAIYFSRFMPPDVISRVVKPEWHLDSDISGNLLHSGPGYEVGKQVAATAYSTIKWVQPWVELLKLSGIEYRSSLSVRKPFLAAPTVNFCFQLPDHYKVLDGKGKVALRGVASGLVPEKILQRKKANFSPPVGIWLSEYLAEAFHSAFEHEGPFNYPEIKKLSDQQNAGFRDWQSELWAIYMMQAWLNSL